jgi:hypothetical protein
LPGWTVRQHYKGEICIGTLIGASSINQFKTEFIGKLFSVKNTAHIRNSVLKSHIPMDITGSNLYGIAYLNPFNKV